MTAPGTAYTELQVTSNFSFLRGASHPQELVAAAAEHGLDAVALTDRNSLAGIVRAHAAAKEAGMRLIVGARLFGLKSVVWGINVDHDEPYFVHKVHSIMRDWKERYQQFLLPLHLLLEKYPFPKFLHHFLAKLSLNLRLLLLPHTWLPLLHFHRQELDHFHH